MRPVKLYWESRLVHINANALAASIASVSISYHFVYLTKHITNHKLAIALLSYGIDGLIDFSIFALLHTLIYHSRIKHALHAKMIAFDLAVLQSHRIYFSFITFGVSVGMHLVLMNLGLSRTLAFVLAYSLGIVVTRVVHTWYGLRTGLFKPLDFIKKRKTITN